MVTKCLWGYFTPESLIIASLQQMGDMQATAPEQFQVFSTERVLEQARGQFKTAQDRPMINIVQSVPPQDPDEEETPDLSLSTVPGFMVLFVFLTGQTTARSIFDEAGTPSMVNPQEAQALEAQNRGVVMTRINEMRTNPVIGVSVETTSQAESGPTLVQFFAYLFPGLTVMFIYFIVAMSSGALLSERETGTLQRLLTATIPKGAILAGKMLACLQVVVMLTVANLAFNTPLGRSPLGLIVVTVVVSFNATALGLMIAALSKTTKQAESIGLIMAFVLAGLGGCACHYAHAVIPFRWYDGDGRQFHPTQPCSGRILPADGRKRRLCPGSPADWHPDRDGGHLLPGHTVEI